MSVLRPRIEFGIVLLPIQLFGCAPKRQSVMSPDTAANSLSCAEASRNTDLHRSNLGRIGLLPQKKTIGATSPCETCLLSPLRDQRARGAASMAAHRRRHPGQLLSPTLLLLLLRRYRHPFRGSSFPFLPWRPIYSSSPSHLPLHVLRPWPPRPGPSRPPPLLILYLCSGIPPCHRTPPPRLGLGLPPSAAHLQFASCCFSSVLSGEQLGRGTKHGPLPQGRQAMQSSLDVILCLVQLH